MKKVIKLGDAIYSQSLQNIEKVYFLNFPQRDTFILENAKNISITTYSHEPIVSIKSLIKEREKLKQFLSLNSFDYILIDNPLSVLLVDENIKTKIVFDCIDWYEEMYLKEFGITFQYYLLKAAFMQIVDRADVTIAQSPVMMEYLESWGLKSKVRKVIPNGYDKSIFYPYEASRTSSLKSEISKKYSIDFKDKKIIVYTGKLGKWYDNLNLICNAIADDQVFIIVGDGPLKDQLPNSKNIIKVGAVPLDKVPDFTNIADLLVFPVDSDCSPIAISEYLAVGKPIVMGRGRMEWLLEDGKTGRMIDNNIHYWKKALSETKPTPRITQHNLALAKDLSWDVLAKEYEKILA